MSDSEEEHQTEWKGDGGASMTFPMQAGGIRKNGHIVINGRPCKVVDISKTEKHGDENCHFVAIDIFNGNRLEATVPSFENCDVPNVRRNEYQLVNIDDGFVNLMTPDGIPKDDVRLPTNQTLRTQIEDAFNEGKDLIVTVVSALGEEQVISVKEAPRG